MTKVRKHPLVSYVLVTFAWTWIFWIFLMFSPLSAESLVRKGLFVIGLSGPLVGSVAISWLIGGQAELKKLLGRLWVWPFSGVYIALALIFGPLLMLLGAALNPSTLHYLLSLVPDSLFLIVPTFCWLLFRSGPVNEEFGWRGFLLPGLLQRHNPFIASCILAPIWGIWHWPLWFISGAPHSHWPFSLFFLMVIPMAFLFTWFYLRTKGSLLIAILFHGSLNTSIKLIPILPPEYASFAPFVLWIVLSMILVGVLIYLNRPLWFARHTALGTKALNSASDSATETVNALASRTPQCQ